MKVLFVTGSDAAFFNSLLILLQSFAERMPGQRLLVCDFGLAPAQVRFLNDLDALLPRPAELAARGVFACKAALACYLRAKVRAIADYDALVWLDADLMLMKIGFADFAAVVGQMKSADTAVAVCSEPLGRNIGEMIATFAAAGKMAPFAQIVARSGIAREAPYFSTGLVFCRSTDILEHWMELAHVVADHPLFEQNMFNVAIEMHAVPTLTLSCEEWQAQGRLLDKVRLAPSCSGGRPAAAIEGRNIKMLHTTSPEAGHLLIANCRMTVGNLELSGPFKLFLAEPLRMQQLQLLAAFMVAHGARLLGLGLCTQAASPAAGFEFVTLQ
jgi:hypothetical protein